jgi:hypothetical protein
MNYFRSIFTQAPDARASVCVTLAVAAALLAAAVPVLAFLLAIGQTGGSHGQVAVRFLYGPYAELVAAALALYSIYCGLVRRYLVGTREPRVQVGVLLSLAVLMYLAFTFSRALWE